MTHGEDSLLQEFAHRIMQNLPNAVCSLILRSVYADSELTKFDDDAKAKISECIVPAMGAWQTLTDCTHRL